MKKCIIMITTIVLSLTILTPMASAKEVTKNSDNMTEQEIIDEMASQLEFLYTQAAETDANGNIIAIDINKLQDKYGDDGSLEELKEAIETQQTEQQEVQQGKYQVKSINSFGKCLVGSLGSAVGVDIIKRAYTKPVKTALKSHHWKKASSILFTNLKKVLGKKASKLLIKKIAHVALPGGLPAKFAFIVAVCGVKEIV